MKRKVLLIIGLFVLIFVSFLAVRSRRKQPSFSVQTASVGDMTVSVSASGVIKAESDITLKFQTSGLLSWVGVEKGDWVKKWQAIASLDKRDLEKRFKKEMNDYLTQRWTFEQTQDDYKTNKEKYLVTDAIQRILDKAQFSLDNSVLDLEIADLAVKFSTIYSPFDGIVVNIGQPFAGVNITPADATFRIVDPESVYFEAQVDETDTANIKAEDQVELKLDAYPNEKFIEKIEKIDFDSITTSSGGTAYNIQVSLPKKNIGFFRLGMNGEAEIISQKIENAIIVPISSLIERDNKTYLWKISNNKFEKTEVVVGVVSNDNVQILSGLKEGEMFAAANINLIKEGIKAKP